tara:strand:- start:54 stop:890 length:837 start_codon:yes stop_codon:yes gene_type:complete
MLHIYTLHFKNDYWVDLQVESFKKHIKVPYKSYAIFSHMNQEMYDRNENNFDYFEVREEGRRLHKGGHYHPTDGNRHIFPIIKENLNDGDVVIRIDSDAFLIDDITDEFIDKINDKKFIAMYEPEHEWDLNYKAPHPAFYAFRSEYLNQGLDKAMGEMHEDGQSNWWGLLLDWFTDNKIDWYPLNRSNKINLHQIYFGIYDDLVYHHFAGSRDKITRVDRKKAGQTQFVKIPTKKMIENLEKIKDENHLIDTDVRKQLSEQPEVFIKYLKGEYEGEFE